MCKDLNLKCPKTCWVLSPVGLCTPRSTTLKLDINPLNAIIIENVVFLGLKFVPRLLSLSIIFGSISSIQTVPYKSTCWLEANQHPLHSVIFNATSCSVWRFSPSLKESLKQQFSDHIFKIFKAYWTIVTAVSQRAANGQQYTHISWHLSCEWFHRSIRHPPLDIHARSNQLTLNLISARFCLPPDTCSNTHTTPASVRDSRGSLTKTSFWRARLEVMRRDLDALSENWMHFLLQKFDLLTPLG